MKSLPAFSFLDDEQLEIAESCSEVCDSVTKIMVAALVPMSFARSFFAILNIVDYCIFMEYLYLIEVRLPKNVL